MIKIMNNYDLDLIELKEYYESIVKLVTGKRELLMDYYDRTEDSANIELLDYLLTNKIIEMKKV